MIDLKCSVTVCPNPAKYMIVGQQFVNGKWEELHACGIHIKYYRKEVFIDRFVRKIK